MKRLLIPAFTIFLALSCNEPGTGDELSYMGFYMNSGEIISSVREGQQDYRKNFLLASAFKKQKNYKKAILYFANSCFKSEYNFQLRLFPHPVYSFMDGFHIKSPYFEDAAYEIARLFYMYRENSYVVKFTEMIDEQDAPVYRDALLLKAKALVKMKKYAEAEETLKNAENIFTDRNSLSMIGIRLASVYEAAEKYSKAADEYLKIIKNKGTGGWKDDVAARRIIYLRDKKNVKISSGRKNLLLAESLHSSGNYREAEDALSKAAELSAEKNFIVLKAELYARKAPSSLPKYIKSIRNNSSMEAASLAAANTLWDTGKKYSAITLYKNIRLSNNDDTASRVLTRLSFFYEERNRPEFINHMNAFINRFPDRELSGRFLWRIGRYYMRIGKTGEALSSMKKSLSLFPDGSWSSNCRYWIYRIMDRQNKLSDAEKARLTSDMCFYSPGSPYTLRHLFYLYGKTDIKKLNTLYMDSVSSGDIKAMHLYHSVLFMKQGYCEEHKERLSDFPESFTAPYIKAASLLKSPSFKGKHSRILEDMEKYFQAGYSDAIYRDMKFIPDKGDSAEDAALALTVYGGKYGQYNFGTFYGFRLLRNLGLKESLAMIPEELAVILYPRPFKKCTEKYSQKFGVQQSLIYAMIKAESNFNHTAKSPAGAAGLMQLMPPTAKGIARNLNIKKYDLDDPCTSIMFGTSYIRWLSGYYKGIPEHIVSGYNAGAGNVNKWIERYRGKGLDYFTEFTPFDETRGYIYYTNKFRLQYEAVYKK